MDQSLLRQWLLPVLGWNEVPTWRNTALQHLCLALRSVALLGTLVLPSGKLATGSGLRR